MITHLGGAVRIVGRRADGQAVVACLDLHGKFTGCTRNAWPHELRGLGWHIAEIKKLVSAAPLFGAAGGPVVKPGSEPATAWESRPLLSAHYAALAQEREDQHHDEFHPPG